MDDQDLNDGPCCVCGEDGKTKGIIMLSVKGQVPGHGWGCVVCNLPFDGAIAVVCVPCMPAFARGEASLKWACRGYAAEDGRVPIEELTEPHDHDPNVEH